jgi:hypothetical protein
MPRWFELEGESPMFDVSVDPVAYYDFMTKEFADSEILSIGPGENGNGED